MRTDRSVPWILILVIYFLVHSLIRTSLGWQLTDHEAALLVQANEFRLIYDGQMPLYVWIQMGAFQLVGISILAFALVKNAILLLICLCIFKMVERSASIDWALAAVMSLLFIPQIAWSSQHGLTAPVLATLGVAATLLSFVSLLKRPTMLRYVSFGAILGFSLISDLCYLWFLAGFVLAALIGPRFRHVLLNKWTGLSLTIAMAIAAAPYLELFKSIDFASFANVPDSFSSSFVLDRARSIYHVLQNALAFTGFLIVGTSLAVYTGLAGKQDIKQETADLRDLLTHSLSFGLLIIFGYVFVTGDSEFSLAALQPLMVLAGPITAMFIYPAIDAATFRKASNVAISAAVLILVCSPAYYSFKAQTSFGSQPDKPQDFITSDNKL